MTTVPEFLTALKDRTGLTDAALARVVGVKQATFNRWRHGVLAVDRRHAPVLARISGAPVTEVVEMIAAQLPEGDEAPAGTFGALVAAWRARDDLSAYAAAKHLGVAGSTLWRWERNETSPAAPAVAGLAEVMGVTVEEAVMAIYRGELVRTAPGRPPG